MLQWHRLAPRLVGLRQHALQHSLALGNGLARTTFVLDGQRGKHARCAGAQCFDQRCDLVDLAAQANHQHARKVGVVGIASQGALQQRQPFAVAAHAAATAMGNGDHAVHVGEGC